ncbi:MAG TPA: 2-amino-4-hydroxy-6-hydroxymethyldihydropteridine diphosphokinase [Brevundimonas sp.]|nr:2-amino-4-hydroxy-6-hydroxymethyldihydropteridine diphosphokinase [Citromicrobium sp.]MAL00422.1 2-amino-4-hydroxy-6-hydroxymethyldihydropteridine diphosphokinase [Citromicrobium sp.]MAO95164.1 2-amino-4-hydroxy-6-hydroxymethyldihydropteridine diphosphokinase [Citromicrobium sp.]MBT47183.1 2-amino-4-hydroxy-6-hydroxymethyldihydropteridine diphosphokinase [Citromicrobium sp.]HAV50882.1 2-amino-4-hydroxy-6-hydroxymethyldihydropteridine diphosphokinase [Brevundimonas sp.]|tara:strand:+ start:607 stop:1143 length:537 start_codon:yes stop_codon:yes gene_type:complete
MADWRRTSDLGATYIIALGSNRRHGEHGRPREVVRAAMEELAALGTVTKRSPVIESAPVGPAQRRFANAAAELESDLTPPDLLRELKRQERSFGRRSGQAWGDRVLDLDIVLWSGGVWDEGGLAIPHMHFRERGFVLGPASAISPTWRDPFTGMSLRHLQARLTRPRGNRRDAPWLDP